MRFFLLFTVCLLALLAYAAAARATSNARPLPTVRTQPIRVKRQRQVIFTDPGLGGGGWAGPVTNINTQGRPGTYWRNSDCVGCNIRA